MIQEQLSTQIEKYLKARYIKKRDNEGKIKVQEHHPYLLTIMTNFDIFGNHPNLKPMKCLSSLKGCSVSLTSNTVFWLRAFFKALNSGC
jgi:hypothetical protein